MESKGKLLITGMGALSPLGIGVEAFWEALVRGECGVRRVSNFPVEGPLYQSKIAAEVPSHDPIPWIKETDPALEGRYGSLALPALGMALQDAGLEPGGDVLARADLYVGSAQETADTLEKSLDSWVKGELERIPADAFSRVIPHAVTSALARNYRIRGRAISLTSSCSSGVLALMLCTDWIRSGKSEIGVVVGADAISPLIFAGESLTGELSKRNDDPAHASRPFDRDQDGYIIGEGAVALVVETDSHAQARGARPYASLGPFAATTDGTSFRYIDQEGTQISRCLSMVLQEVPADRIDHISAHAPSIVALDRAESKAIRRTFGEWADRIPVTSIKGAIGNPSAAGGLLQIVSAVLGIRDGVIAPTLNLENPLPGCDLNYVQRSPRRVKMSTVLISAHGGGGLNAALTVHACCSESRRGNSAGS